MSEQVENKYLNGKIYMIGSKHTDLVYIGSTVNTLEHRLKHHEIDFKRYKNNKYHKVTSFEILELGDYYILLLENVKVKTKIDLEIIEGNYIRKFKNVNKLIPGRTSKEYCKDNKDEINRKKNEKFHCVCGSEFRKADKTRHLKTSKHIKYELNKTLNQ